MITRSSIFLCWFFGAMLPFTGAQDIIINPPGTTPTASITSTTSASERSCGGVLKSTQERQEIAHYTFRNEGFRCSWILNAPNATDYQITLTELRWANVTVTAFPEGREKQRILELNKNYLIHGPILVITFSVNSSFGSTTATGYFGLVYSPVISLDGDELQISTELSPGSSSSPYLNVFPNRLGSNSLSILVQSPSLRDPSIQFYTLTLDLSQLNGTSRSCPDRVTVWTFNTTAARWYRHARLCGDEEEPRNPVYIHTDIFMIVYEREALRSSQRIGYAFSDKITGPKQSFYRKGLF